MKDHIFILLFLGAVLFTVGLLLWNDESEEKEKARSILLEKARKTKAAIKAERERVKAIEQEIEQIENSKPLTDGTDKEEE